MKPFLIILAIIVVLIVIYLFYLNKQKTAPITNVTNYNSGYELGLQLANLIKNTKCGKEGRPPCTKDELKAEGWSDEQIAAAEQVSLVAQNSALCQYFGINC